MMPPRRRFQRLFAQRRGFSTPTSSRRVLPRLQSRKPRRLSRTSPGRMRFSQTRRSGSTTTSHARTAPTLPGLPVAVAVPMRRPVRSGSHAPGRHPKRTSGRGGGERPRRPPKEQPPRSSRDDVRRRRSACGRRSFGVMHWEAIGSSLPTCPSRRKRGGQGGRRAVDCGREMVEARLRDSAKGSSERQLRLTARRIVPRTTTATPPASLVSTSASTWTALTSTTSSQWRPSTQRPKPWAGAVARFGAWQDPRRPAARAMGKRVPRPQRASPCPRRRRRRRSVPIARCSDP
mmetsp:Transcript_43195/g.92172  ORF Transcript_43195/g.92172 Transcript_43195/m.92172 type:complete len:290 (-) Transcript_43195:7-876(-)